MKETALRVQDMSCMHCVAAVKNALTEVPGVESADVSLDTKVARIRHEEGVEIPTLMAAVQSAGYTPELD